MVNVAVLGFGTVGSGVAEVLTGHESSIEPVLPPDDPFVPAVDEWGNPIF